MSYADRNSSSNQKVLTGGVVALIQVGAVLALINGLAVTMLKPVPGPRLEGEQIRLTPPPPLPEEKPIPQPETRQIQDTVLTAPKPDIKVPASSDFTVSDRSEGPVSTAAATGSAQGDVIAQPGPTPSPSPRFQPIGAMPRGNPGNWVSTQDYPSADLRAEHQGLVRFRLDIDARGRVGQCTIVTSSGYSGLDEATCKNVSRRARFEPATDADGLTVGGSYMGTIRWVIPRD